MDAKEFITNKINELVSIFPTTRCRYEHHFLSNSHFIEVIPNEIYHLDDKFSTWEEDITFEFIKAFPDQNICFISDDATVSVSNIDYERKGILFDIPFTINQQLLNFDLNYVHIDNVISQPVTLPIAITHTCGNNIILTEAALKYDNGLKWNVDFLNNSLEKSHVKETSGNNYDYALAA
jgi:hypothetical protein